MTDKSVPRTLARWADHPDQFVREVFGVTPDPWQDEALQAFPHSPRLAMKASKGPGKTCTEAWLCWNFLLTRPHPNIAATSISADNLRDNLWKEMAVWYGKSELIKSQFVWQKERIFHKDHEATWFMSARSWAKAANQDQLGNTLAGLHSPYIMFVLDESGGMPVPILQSAEGALANCTEGHIVQAGNTNALDGALYAACVLQKHLWRVIVITGDPDDPKRSSRVPIEWARDLIRTYGRENQFVKVMVLGEWPSASLNSLLGPEDVEKAFRRVYQEHDIAHAARVLGVDVARFGDDASVIFPRQGLVAFKPHIMRGATGTHGAGQVARVWEDWDVDAVFVDNTGGYGASWIDQLEVLNRRPISVGFAEEPEDKRYFNRRAEMYFRMAEWVKAGGALPDEPELVAELTQTTYTYKGDRLLLEPKESIKAKIGRSPDKADALALTFAARVQRRNDLPANLRPHRQEENYDPFRAYLTPR